ncbi:CCA tRNA nucleotidyltransferase [Candidatus Latescibacterota bacterium]
MSSWGGAPFEVTGFRKDGVYEDGRHPITTQPADEAVDAARRDFTINGMFYDPVEERVIDYVGGERDIRGRVIRSIANPRERFSEDRLRMLRAVRFAARFSFDIEHETAVAIREGAAKVVDISAERTGDELAKMLSGPNAGRVLTLLDETGLLEVVLPEVSALKDTLQPPQFHPEGDVFEHTRLMLEMFDSGNTSLAFGILLHDIGKPLTMTRTDRIRFSRHDTVGEEITERILKRYRFPNELISRVKWLVRNHMRFINVPKMRRSTLMRFITSEGMAELLELYRLDCLASHGRLDVYDYLLTVIEEEKASNGELALPVQLLTGKDLVTLGYSPGPVFGEVLNALHDCQLEGEVKTREEAIDFVRRMFQEQAFPNVRKQRKSRRD